MDDIRAFYEIWEREAKFLCKCLIKPLRSASATADWELVQNGFNYILGTSRKLS